MTKPLKRRIKRRLRKLGNEGFFYDIYLAFYRLWHNVIKQKYWNLKNHLVRTTRGYADCDLWDMGYHLSGHILKCLRAFKKSPRSGYPSNFHFKKNAKNWEDTIPSKLASERWEQTIQDMIDGFEFLRHSDDKWSKLYKKMIDIEGKPQAEFDAEWKRQSNEAERKAKKFITYLNALWD